MNITNNIDKYRNEMAQMAYEKYCKEIKAHPCLTPKSQISFTDFFQEKLQGMNAVVGLENNSCVGFLLYSLRDENQLYCNIPVWGYGAQSPKNVQTMSILFQYLAEQIVSKKTVCFSLRLYAHDVEIQKLFSFMQFGIQSEKGIRHISEIKYTAKYTVREIEKGELQQRWPEIWSLLARLISHLQKSPIFYPGKEFTEEVYRDFFADPETKVYIAEDQQKIIGLIEANPENMDYLFSGVQAMNVGEAYVEPAYRGQMVAQALLHRLDLDLKENGMEYEWVEHGTANPNARGFWGKYFETTEYEFIRDIPAVE